MSAKRFLLVILDGWGHNSDPAVSAITKANTPFVDSLYQNYPNSELITFGEEVGLPEGQMGNSEVGHLNIGAGRVVYQELARINKAIKDRELHQHPTLLEAIEYAKEHDKPIHLMGLVSDGGVHSHINHLKALCDITKEQNAPRVYIHAFMDGRDTDPKAGAGYLQDLLDHIDGTNVQLASVIGRYYAMDRDKRWERIKKAYDLMVKGEGEKTTNIVESIQQRYKAKETDEFLMPLIVTDHADNPITTLNNGDVLICFNFRTDRPREISTVLTQTDMPDYEMQKLDLHYVTMTRYDDKFEKVAVIFTKEDVQNTIGEVLSKEGKTQVRIAETEKYPHVTFFFSGGREKEFEGERRILVSSPKVATYDLKPSMSALDITEAIIQDIKDNQPDFICLNYANTDMVGHTGIFEAAMEAAEIVDNCTEKLIATALKHDYEAIIIADHGNSDVMVNPDGSPNTAHTKNLVPCFFISNNEKDVQLKDGKLADIAPTILTRLGIALPEEMDGDLLLS